MTSHEKTQKYVDKKLLTLYTFSADIGLNKTEGYQGKGHDNVFNKLEFAI